MSPSLTLSRALRLAALALVASPASAQLRADGPPVRVFADDTPALAPVWSPDGTRLAFTREGYVGLWTVGADGAETRQLSGEPGAGFGFAWSPEGGAIAARVARLDGVRRSDAVKLFPVSGEAETLVDYQDAATSLPRWLDATRVGVVRGGVLDVRPTSDAPRLAPLSGEALVGTGAEGLRIADLGANTLREVTPIDGARLLNAVASPDGERVAFEVVGGNAFVARRDGSGLVDLGPGHRPAWSPDGRWVALQQTEDDGHAFTAADLVAVRSDGSARVVLTDTPDRLEMNPSWSPDGRAIAFDEGGALYLLPVTGVSR